MAFGSLVSPSVGSLARRQTIGTISPLSSSIFRFRHLMFSTNMSVNEHRGISSVPNTRTTRKGARNTRIAILTVNTTIPLVSKR